MTNYKFDAMYETSKEVDDILENIGKEGNDREFNFGTKKRKNQIATYNEISNKYNLNINNSDITVMVKLHIFFKFLK